MNSKRQLEHSARFIRDNTKFLDREVKRMQGLPPGAEGIMLVKSFVKNPEFWNTQLRDGLQSEGAHLKKDRDAVRVARLILSLGGISELEAGSACVAANDDVAARQRVQSELTRIMLVAQAGLNARVSALVRNRRDDIDTAIYCGVGQINMLTSASDIHLKVNQRGASREEHIRKACDNIKYALDMANGDFVAAAYLEDASRGHPAYVADAARAYQEAGAKYVIFCDTLGEGAPDYIYKYMRYMLGQGVEDIIYHGHNDSAYGAAGTEFALMAGAAGADGTLFWAGERAGNASAETLAINLLRRHGVRTFRRMEKIWPVCHEVARLMNLPISADAPNVGGRTKTHKAGIHVAAMGKDVESYEPYPPEAIGAARKIVTSAVGGKSNVHAHFERLFRRKMPDGLQSAFSLSLKQLAHGKDDFSDTEFLMALNRLLDKKIERPLKVVEFVAMTGNRITPMANLRIKTRGDGVRPIAETGKGQVDAIYKAIGKEAAKHGCRLKTFNVDPILGGSDSKVTVRISVAKNGRQISAVGRHWDIIQAAEKAFVDAIYGLEILENFPHAPDLKAELGGGCGAQKK